MQEDRYRIYKRLLIEIFVAAVALAGLALLGGKVFSILLPFLCAFVMAWAFNPVIRVLQKHLRLTRKLFSYILVLVFYFIIFGLCVFFISQLVSQAVDLAKATPMIVAELQNVYNQLSTSLHEVLTKLPEEYGGVETEVLSWLSSAWAWLRGLISSGLSITMSVTSGVATQIPAFVIFLTVLVLASCIITADFPNLRENIYTFIGKRVENSLRLMGHSFRDAVLGFFRSQLIFAIIDMAIILIAFLIIGVPYPLPIALILCFLDFIPFFGAGTVLVPWGAVCIVLGLTTMGIQLLILYAILYILRRIFEPRILGGTTGFSSLQMLFSMYAGMQLAGVTGLVIAPIIWITAVNFIRTGILDGVWSDILFVLHDLQHSIARAPQASAQTQSAEPGEAPAAAPETEKKKHLFRKKKH